MVTYNFPLKILLLDFIIHSSAMKVKIRNYYYDAYKEKFSKFHANFLTSDQLRAKI